MSVVLKVMVVADRDLSSSNSVNCFLFLDDQEGTNFTATA